MNPLALRQPRVDPILQSQARPTAEAAPNTQVMDGYTGFRLDINVSAISGTSSFGIVFTVEFHDELTGDWFTGLASASKGATGRFSLTVDPRVAGSSNVALNGIPTNQWRLKATYTTITSATYSAVATYSL